ncbi:UDP-glucosyltransferase 29 [Sesamum angolense]|uniref:UDP-glucosyltransferase 29 n=1 Tax=Sesamum angolense TaxID=2727404 RepID=A0AAE2C1J0_9LAMI|nr:UDP-glucosyltransferase 29 [Sesamum angolense]
MYFGVPVIAMPIKFDQPINARLLVEASAGVEVRRDENGLFSAKAEQAENEAAQELLWLCKKKLVQLHLEPFPELPPHYHTTKNLPSDLGSTLLKAFQTSNSSFSDIISTLRPDLVIYDVFQPWAAKVASSQDFLFGNFKQSCDIILSKTSRGFEGEYIDYLSALCNKKIVPVGPLISDDNQNNEEHSDIIQWLSKNKTLHSTVLISFGSEYFLSKIEIEEIVKGLELCDVNFIWIIRFPVGVTITLEEALPKGFTNRAADRGIVVTGWAPQADILAHPNTGGFISHCGWSSIMESMYFGVPVIAMPMKLDQPINARMLSAAGSCVEVPRNENEVFKGEEIANAIKKVFVEESGDGLRRRARELSETMKPEKKQVLDEVADQLWQLCLKNEVQGS